MIHLTDFNAIRAFIENNKNLFGCDNGENMEVLESFGFDVMDLIDSEFLKVEIILITVLEAV